MMQLRIRPFRWGVLSAGIVFLVSPTSLRAQLDQGEIAGQVRDTGNAIIRNAEVRLVNTETGVIFLVKTNADGLFNFPSIRIGNYNLTVSSDGFRTLVHDDIHLNLQQHLRYNLVLQPGDVSDKITVTSDEPVLQSQDASVGQVITTDTINATPLNQRNWVYIAQYTPGVAPSHGSRAAGNGDFYANGQRAEQNNFVLDGVDNNAYAPDYLNGASYSTLPPPDALAEFKIQTANYSAEFGHSAGGVVNASIRSGSNQIHGSVWEYFRNDILNARNFNALTIPKYRQNQFGGTLGLPILKNKLFVFGYTEANRIVFGQTGTYTVPTPLMRQGNFTELLSPSLTGSAQAVTLYQPGSAGTQALQCNGQANVICPNQVNAVAAKLFSLFPAPNANGAKTYNNYVTNTNATSNSFQFGVRTDWNISSKDQTFARYSYVKIPSMYPPPLGSMLDGGGYGSDGSVVNLSQTFAFSETHVFNSGFINESRYSYNYGDYEFLQSNYDKDVATPLGLGGVPTGPNFGGLPAFSVGGVSSFGTPGYFPAGKHTNEYQLLDNVTKLIGKHSIKFGADFQSIRVNLNSTYSYPRGGYNFSGRYTSIPGQSYTGYGAADFLLDQMASTGVSYTTPAHLSRWYRSAYFEDDWRITPKLTLNLGVRYDNFQPFKELDGQQATFNPTAPLNPGSSAGVYTYPAQDRGVTLAPVFLNYLSSSNVTVGYSNNPFLTDMGKANFGPRIGFAFSPDARSVIRGGYGIFYGGLDLQVDDGIPAAYPYRFNSSYPQPTVCTPGNCPSNGITLENGLTAAISAGLINAVATPSFNGVAPNLPPAYSMNYNFSVEHAFRSDLVATIGYVGTGNRHLGVNLAINSPAALTDPRLSSALVEPFPKLGGITVGYDIGTASYNSLQAKLQKRLAHGLSFLATYTYAHALDNAPEILGSTGDAGYRNVNLTGIGSEYSNSPWDVRHRVTLMGFYALPFGEGRQFLNRAGVANFLLGGWSTDLTFAAQTGQPFTVNTDLGSAGPNGGSAHAIMIRDPFKPGGTPDPSNPGITCAQKTRTLQHWYNPCAFANPPLAFPAAAVAGSPVSNTQIVGAAALPYLGSPRNNMHGPGYERINLSIFKDFHLYREGGLQFRTDVFNVFNTPAYGVPSTTDNSTNGGLITAPQTFQNFSPDARFFQFSAKVRF